MIAENQPTLSAVLVISSATAVRQPDIKAHGHYIVSTG